jgi:hypothetical protein
MAVIMRPHPIGARIRRTGIVTSMPAVTGTYVRNHRRGARRNIHSRSPGHRLLRPHAFLRTSNFLPKEQVPVILFSFSWPPHAEVSAGGSPNPNWLENQWLGKRQLGRASPLLVVFSQLLQDLNLARNLSLELGIGQTQGVGFHAEQHPADRAPEQKRGSAKIGR